MNVPSFFDKVFRSLPERFRLTFQVIFEMEKLFGIVVIERLHINRKRYIKKQKKNPVKRLPDAFIYSA